MPPQCCIGRRGKGGAVLLGNDLLGDAGLRRPLQPLRLRPVADDEHDLGGVGGVRRGFDQRLQIRAAP